MRASSRWIAWLLVIMGLAMLAFATVGVRVLLALLEALGFSPAANEATTGTIMIDMIGMGILWLIAGLIFALARSGRRQAKWLIGGGMVLLCAGSGPLLVVALLAKLGLTADPDPALFGMLAAVTFIPAIVLLTIGGGLALANRKFAPDA